MNGEYWRNLFSSEKGYQSTAVGNDWKAKVDSTKLSLIDGIDLEPMTTRNRNDGISQ